MHRHCKLHTSSTAASIVNVYTSLADRFALCRYQRFVFKHNMYKLREERNIKPSTFGQLVSSTLYEKR